MKLSVLGSTGSVGSNALQIVSAYRGRFELVGIMARRASPQLLLQAQQLRPRYVVSYEEPTSHWLSSLPEGTKYLRGEEGLMALLEESERILNAISGVDGLLPTYHTLTKGKVLLASNKESVICLPDLIREHISRVVPVDSEHNALFQLLSFVDPHHVKKVYLTASGGPFKDTPLQELPYVRVEQALNHPRWKMGKKITVDSATLINKGIEIIEAQVLFDLSPETIEVVIHPQSYVHGIVSLKDGSFLFHTSQTDMKVPLLHALFYPERVEYPFQQMDLLDLSPITFEPVDTQKFRAVDICRWVAKRGGVYVPVLLGADEAAVEMFLAGEIPFTGIVETIEKVLNAVNLPDPKSLEDIIEAVRWGYHKAREMAKVL
ncbi:1-deoxy-D-xylulose 5-phosphate reductoisomerase [Thermocrinis albus DSM 14484]|uniref:1-deoxy-D-xylulose 5-phosphate reductoisomerase n=1 Tax=Thermocrinis albus (strain DSM 14484 / JCM 11386 / HI 11/12) TaxID=638303 RepID=D3SPB0_THEAH|nr:1-deoxy-D-xylulose-5-phosphate reductoisomerase [Thermocrinis albus]ADC88997.1 1-deoxy-D-xylulose 5-phosphate reductoisomerase [Thermocrinis albus DSM 14484]